MSEDVGSSPNEQAAMLAPTLDKRKPQGSSSNLSLSGGAKKPTDLPLELLAINLAYRTYEDAYTRLGPYEAAIKFTPSLVDLSQDGLIGPSTLSPKVVKSAGDIDKAVAAGACA
ncbi:MAG: hypothetical protein IPH38_11150 [Candidatus Microthrix sp.]|nr:hypothetical protein [Candidatus Microthrix sp.]MBK7020118.1 hypothetical protein [Candidatus Microthrix sp.]